jgi:hypothetical protein
MDVTEIDHMSVNWFRIRSEIGWAFMVTVVIRKQLLREDTIPEQWSNFLAL